MHFVIYHAQRACTYICFIATTVKKIKILAWRHVLVIKYNVGQPYMLAGHVEFSDTAVFQRIPLELVVLPFLKLFI